MKHLATFFRNERHKRGLTLRQLAILIGYRNVRKGESRIARFEQNGRIDEEVFARLADVLEISYPTVEELLEQDRQADAQEKVRS